MLSPKYQKPINCLINYLINRKYELTGSFETLVLSRHKVVVLGSSSAVTAQKFAFGLVPICLCYKYISSLLIRVPITMQISCHNSLMGFLTITFVDFFGIDKTDTFIFDEIGFLLS